MNPELIHLIQDQEADTRRQFTLRQSLPDMVKTLASLTPEGMRSGMLLGISNAVTIYRPSMLPWLRTIQREEIGRTVKEICWLCRERTLRSEAIHNQMQRSE